MYLFCTHRLIMLYTCTKIHQSISKGFRVTDPDSRADARVVANGCTDRCTNGRKTGSLYSTMPEAGTTKNTLPYKSDITYSRILDVLFF